MAPKQSTRQIDEKLKRLHEFVKDHVGLLASRDSASLRQCLRQTASAEEKGWYNFLLKNANAFSASQNERIERAYALVAPRAAVLPEPAATMLAELPGPVVVLPEPAAEHPAHKKARSIAPTDVLAPLQTVPVLKAVEYLEALPAQHGVDQLRHVLQQWRAVGTLGNKDEQRRQLRQVAADLGIPLPRGVAEDLTKVSQSIADGFTAKVSALRTFVVSSAGAMAGRKAATAVVAAQVATRDSGAGEPAGGRQGAARRRATMPPRGQTVETKCRLKPVEPREENHCHGLAAVQRRKKLLEQDVPIRPHMHRRKSL